MRAVSAQEWKAHLEGAVNIVLRRLQKMEWKPLKLFAWLRVNQRASTPAVTGHGREAGACACACTREHRREQQQTLPPLWSGPYHLPSNRCPPPSAVHQQAINPGSHLPVRLWSSGMSTWDLRPSELWEHLGGGVGEMQPWGEREDVQRHSYTDEGQHVDSQQDWWLSSSGQISKVWV